jgi:alpha-mannosidase
MPLTVSQRLARLNVRLAELAFWRARERVPVTGWTIDGAPLAPGGSWPNRQGVKRLAAEAQVPAHWPIESTRLMLDVGGESLLALTSDGRMVRFGLDPYHQEFPVAGRKVAIETESVARLPFGEPVAEPRLNRAELIWLDLEVDRLHLLLKQIAETVEQLIDHEVAPLLLDAAEQAHRALEWPSETRDYIARFGDYSQQRGVWQLPELRADPPGLNQAERASVAAAHAALTAALRRCSSAFRRRARSCSPGMRISTSPGSGRMPRRGGRCAVPSIRRWR